MIHNDHHSIERRTDRRIATLQTAILHVVADNSSIPVSIRDFSRRGIGVAIHRKVAPGETVVIESRHGFLVGAVRHLRPLNDGWIAGIQLESVAAHTAVLTEMAGETAGV